MLRHVEHTHHDVPGVGDDEHRGEGFENPLEEQECIKIVQVVAVNQHLDQLQAHDEGQNDASDRNHDIFRKAANHAEDAAVPRLRRSTHRGGGIRDLRVDAVKQPCEVADDSANQQPLQPFGHFIPNKIQAGLPPLSPLPEPRERAKDWLVCISRTGRRAGEQGSCRSGQRRRRP